MRISFCGSDLRAAVCALALALVTVMGACSSEPGPARTLDSDCKEEGTCECVRGSDCPGAQVCVNGECKTLVVDTPDEGEDPGEAPPDEGPDPGGTPVDVELEIEEGGFLWPCEEDSQCNSEKCWPLPGQDVCTVTCLESCPAPGWDCRGITEGSGVIFYCIPEIDRLCEACVGDDTCPGASNLCVETGGVDSCLTACVGDDNACPEGYACQDVTSVDGVEARQCVPESGFCQCTSDNAGTVLNCTVDNEFGSCLGEQLCQEGGVLTACDAKTPAKETCNGEDDDCNGFVDDDVEPGTCEETNDFGTCEGQLLCLPEVGEVCNAAIPAVETCDNLDNDCDGTADEDFKDGDGLYGLIGHCGGCNLTCEGKFAHAASVLCDTSNLDSGPFCKVDECDEGYVKASDFLCVQPGDHLCETCTVDASCGGPFDKCVQIDPTDSRSFCLRDCSTGSIYGTQCPTGYTCTAMTIDGADFEQCVPDNNSCDCFELNEGQEKPCTIANEFGTCFGVAVCDAENGWTGCTASTAAEETCNGADDNCNGIIDEGLGGKACTNDNEFGSCPGIEVCDPGVGVYCPAPDAAPDVCDGADNDCDGLTDEDFADNITGPDGAVVALKYSLTNDNCGGCGLPCVATPPAVSVSCDGSGQNVFCRIDACEDGYYVFQGTACLPIPTSSLCLPCADDGDCQGPSDSCIAYGDGGFCGRDCSEGSLYSVGEPGDQGYCTGNEGEQGCCPGGYLCNGGQCVRESGACDCNLDGKVKPCSTENAFGTCQGVETCVTTGPNAGWQPCSAPLASPEVCDGIDNDCDGAVDVADDSVDTTGLPGYPACENVSDACSGSWACAAVSGEFQWVCSAPSPSTEQCNGADDDCDGVVDNGFVAADGQYTLLEHCGGCGLDCTAAVANLQSDGAGVAEGAVTCELVAGSPTCVVQDCEPGFIPFPADGTALFCLPLAAQNCQPCATDGDCGFAGDKCVGVGGDAGTFCAQRCDAGAPYAGCTGAAGEQGCCPAGFTCQDQGGELLCAPDSNSCQCSALNDGLTQVCTATADGGATTCFGTRTCQDTGGGVYGWGSCDLSANVEVCDGKDNNCDGQIDEGYVVGGEYTTQAHCGQCGRNCDFAFSEATQHVFGVCDPDLPGGPECAIGGCTSDLVGGGTPCNEDADCGGGETCLPTLNQCGEACSGDADCGGGVCRDGVCAAGCGGDGDCAAFGETAVCDAGACVTAYTWVDLDGLPGNGCECAAADLLSLDTPEVFASYPLPGANYVDRDCDGVDGDLQTALFVQSGASGDGSYAAPFGSIQDAIDAFEGGTHSHILVATGSYSERIVLKDGVQLFGGYASDFMHRDIVLLPTVIAGPEPDFGGAVTPGTVHATGITAATTVAGFVIVGYDVKTVGQSSYAVYLAGSSDALVIANNQIIGGRGGPGAAGAAGSPGADGNDGQDGLFASECSNQSCNNNSQPGGLGGFNSACASNATSGCAGMEADDDNVQQADNPAPGCSYATGGDSPIYQGGGSYDHCKYDCTIPSGDVNGPSGSDGSGGGGGSGGSGCSVGAGSVSGGVWTGATGSSGGSGTAGSGGQGGSAGGYVENNNNTNCSIGNPVGDLGGSGGGGGAGGCGGAGGQPGTSGGATFGVFAASNAGGTWPVVAGNVFTRGLGGNGGNGGNGGTGGKGGTGGTGGGAGWPAWCAGQGGAGGRGGDGGAGAGGGGGCGGPSFDIAGVGIPTGSALSANTFTLGDGVSTGGTGGQGGGSPVGAGSGSTGSTGESGRVYQY